MAPPKAYAWPKSMHQDPDVLALDPEGRFVLCRACQDYYAKYGGKTPKPVAMNACFRARAWETHKRRTRAHRDTPALGPQGHLNDRSKDPAATRAYAWQGEQDDNDTLDIQAYERANSIWIEEEYSSRSRGDTTRYTPTHGCNRSRHVRVSPLELAVPDLTARVKSSREPPSRSSSGFTIRNILNPGAHDQLDEWASDITPQERYEMQHHGHEHWREQDNQHARHFHARPCCDGHSDTHDLYWTTMRRLFSNSTLQMQDVDATAAIEP